MQNITKEIINSIPFDNFFEELKSDSNAEEFFGVCGKEHYRLLAYLSTLINDSNIVEIGTHTGYSALALAYNKSNTVHTFDIIDNVTNHKIKEVENIKFHKQDLFTEYGQNIWGDTILKSGFIFLDVEPHNGFMESEMYRFLNMNFYKGFVVCDDIWYFKEMRDNFWYKIPYNYRYDLTEFGHFSGTGIFTFDENIFFEKNDNSDWTLVTAYFNLAKCPDASKEIIERDQEYYMSHSLSTLHLPYNLVIYCDKESSILIKNMRPFYLRNKTKYVIREFDDFCMYKNGVALNENVGQYREKIISNRQKNVPKYIDNRNTASYYLFCLTRYMMLKEVIEENYFNSTHFCWINFCIERMGISNVYRLDEALAVKRDKFSTCYIDYISHDLIKDTGKYFEWGRCSMCSGFFTGNKQYMFDTCDLIENKFLEYLELGYGHADEQLYSPVYFENPHLFEHYFGDYNQMITNYKYIHECPEKPVYNFIRNSFLHNNYTKCLEACDFLLKSYAMGKCDSIKDHLDEINDYRNNILF
jgi:hypothetical protein